MKTQLGDPQTGEGKHPPGGYTIGKDDFSHPPPDRYSPTTRKRNTTMSLQDGISHLQWRGRSTVLANMPLSLLRRATYIRSEEGGHCLLPSGERCPNVVWLVQG